MRRESGTGELIVNERELFCLCVWAVQGGKWGVGVLMETDRQRGECDSLPN